VTSYNTDTSGERIENWQVPDVRRHDLPGVTSYEFKGKVTAEVDTSGAALIFYNEVDKEFIQLFIKARQTFFKKNADYGNSWREHGLKGVFIRWADKYKRLNNLLWFGSIAEVEDESIGDTIDDAFIYNLMMMLLWQKKELNGND
jgi:hypothetical protein